MRMRLGVGVCVVLLAVAMAWVRAEDKPADAKPAKKASAKLVQPWNKLSGLTDDQKNQIKAIHSAAVEEIKKIRDKEEADIVALLTDEQKAELKALQEKSGAEKKEKSAKKETPAAE